MPRILLVGAGLTSAITASILRHQLPKANLIVWEKSRGSGGRMSSFRNSTDDSALLDLGAQYITATPDYANRHSLYYKELTDAGVLTPLTAQVEGMKETEVGTKQYVTPAGVSSIVKHFLKKADSQMRFGLHVKNINSSGAGWEVNAATGEKDNFDVVVLTMPVPQILGLEGNISQLIESNKKLHDQLKGVDYSSRYALGMFFSKDSNISLKDEYCAIYITNDSIVRFVAIDNLKRGIVNTSPSVVIHTSVPFGKTYVDNTNEEVLPLLINRVKTMFPEWPEPVVTKCQKWRYSQVTSAFPGLPGAVKIGEGLIAGGDGFTHSNLDGCIESAKAVADAVLQSTGSKM